MPNWCSSNICFTGEEKELSEFRGKVMEYMVKDNDNEKVGFTNWLGSVVEGFGFKWEDIACRGAINDVGDIDKYKESLYKFFLYTQTAWGPMIEMWDNILEKFYPNINYVYIAEEPGMEIYINTDTDGDIFGDAFHVDYCLPKGKFKGVADSDWNSEYYSSEEELIKDLKSITEKEFDTYQEYVDYINGELDSCENKGDFFFYLHKFEEE